MGALLVMLRQRGETPAEIAGMVRAMKKACRPVNVSTRPHLFIPVMAEGRNPHDTPVETSQATRASLCFIQAKP